MRALTKYTSIRAAANMESQ